MRGDPSFIHCFGGALSALLRSRRSFEPSHYLFQFPGSHLRRMTKPSGLYSQVASTRFKSSRASRPSFRALSLFQQFIDDGVSRVRDHANLESKSNQHSGGSSSLTAMQSDIYRAIAQSRQKCQHQHQHQHHINTTWMLTYNHLWLGHIQKLRRTPI